MVIIRAKVRIRIPRITGIVGSNIRLLGEENFNYGVSPDRAKLLKLVAFGISSPTTLSRRANIPRSRVFRYLNALVSRGWLINNGGYYHLAASIFLVYRVERINDIVALEVLNDKGAIVDQKAGLVIINGREPALACPRCPLLQECTNNVKSISRSIGVKIKSATPADAYLELISDIINEGLLKILGNNYIELPLDGKPPVIVLRHGVGGN